MSNAQHSQATPSWGTPADIIASVKLVFGGVIDCDPFSSELFNSVVGARQIYTREESAFGKIWSGNNLINPPGEENGSIVKRAWVEMVQQYQDGIITSAFWVGFNINQLQTLQNTKTTAHPMDFPFCIPRKRLCFSLTEEDSQESLFGGENNTELAQGTQPAHPNFIGFLPDRSKPWHSETFRREFSQYGDVRV